MSEIIDLNARGTLEKKIVGALKMAIDAHGPITRLNISSAAHRVITAIKEHNRAMRKSAHA